ncbi:LacI family DNA-binding transcriptional regulator [Brevibacterium album]|uniref:substrate-binding domain-containing protein n=1 Tax=Brevibacterium album TaxID=417948 RepID=UPI000405E128|nr:LacI family DNA-binding transcriptional regulator [Brevibacterium album]
MAVTVGDVAQRAGTSATTVSRVINDRGPVAAATAARVRQAMEELGYSRSTLLPVAHHPLVAVGVPVRPEHWQLEVMGRVSDALQQMGMLTSAPALGADLSELRATVRAGASLVVTPTFAPLDVPLPVVRFAEATARPEDRPAHSGERIAARIDLTGGLSLAFDHLSKMGHRRIGLICNDTGMLADQLQDRFLSEHPMAGLSERLPEWIARVPKSASGGTEAAIALKDRTCTAAIVQSGLQLYGVFRGIAARGLAVPRDLSVVGLGDSLTVRFIRPPATVLGFDTDAMAEALTAGARTALGVPGPGLPSVPPTFRPMLIARRSTTAVQR